VLIPAVTPDPGGDDEVLTPREVAVLFRVDAKTVTRWAKAAKLRSFRALGGHRRYYASDIRTRIRDASTNP